MIPSVLPTYNRAPLAFVRGEGSWLLAEDGRRYLDLGGGIAAYKSADLLRRLTESGHDVRVVAWELSDDESSATRLRTVVAGLARRLLDPWKSAPAKATAPTPTAPARMMNERRDFNPFANITPEEWGKYTGRCVAVDEDRGGVVADAATIEDLYALMQEKHPEIRFAATPVADLSSLTREQYVKLCQEGADLNESLGGEMPMEGDF